MRTTVEISNEQHRTLSALAQRRDLRGFSQLVQEALESYLRDLHGDEIGVLLDLEGTLSEREEAQLWGPAERDDGLQLMDVKVT